jgi:hypothetical protein
MSHSNSSVRSRRERIRSFTCCTIVLDDGRFPGILLFSSAELEPSQQYLAAFAASVQTSGMTLTA